jgi:hypothetical protein
METITETKPKIWKAKRMFWFDEVTSEVERENNYPPIVRRAVVFGLTEDNFAWYQAGLFWSRSDGHKTTDDARVTIERMNQSLQRLLDYDAELDPVTLTDEEWTVMIEGDRKKYNGTWFDEGEVPPMIPNFGVAMGIMSGPVVWTGTAALCCGCKNLLVTISKGKEEKVIAEHGTWGCVNDNKRFSFTHQRMSEEL